MVRHATFFAAMIDDRELVARRASDAVDLVKMAATRRAIDQASCGPRADVERVVRRPASTTSMIVVRCPQPVPVGDEHRSCS